MKVITAAIALLLLCVPAAQAQDISASDSVTLLLPPMLRDPFTGDLSQIRKRGVLRALVTPSRTDFFLDGARPRGVFVEVLEPYRKSLNKGLKRRDLHLVIKYVIVPFNDLIPALLEGRGDIVVANLTVTPEREAQVAFASGKKGNVDELLVVHKDITGIDSLDDLAGRTVQVLAGSSYATHLRALSERLMANGAVPINVVEADPLLVTEDLLELVNAGVVAVTVADDYRARLWARVLPDIVVREDIKVNTGGTLGWAVRKENPQLLKSVQVVAAKLRAGSLIGNTLIKRYYGSTKWIKNPTSKKEQQKLNRLIALFKRYGEQYGFDWIALAAQGYQESSLDHRAKSPAGAVGVMQLLPSTAKDKNVGIADISSVENNIHAGVKYLAFVRERYFSGPALSEEDRLAFSWAAYNAGPRKVKRMRAKTEKLGLDPNRWFGNVEHGALAVVGQETVRYVRNIYKYYVTYKALLERREAHADKVRAARSKSD
jgi:membrane-bound lytic murein transglycosylase MltF